MYKNLKPNEKQIEQAYLTLKYNQNVEETSQKKLKEGKKN